MILMDYLHLWKGNIGRVGMGRPTKKGQENDNSSIFYPAKWGAQKPLRN
jgi:hypothetical protein